MSTTASEIAQAVAALRRGYFEMSPGNFELPDGSPMDNETANGWSTTVYTAALGHRPSSLKVDQYGTVVGAQVNPKASKDVSPVVDISRIMDWTQKPPTNVCMLAPWPRVWLGCRINCFNFVVLAETWETKPEDHNVLPTHSRAAWENAKWTTRCWLWLTQPGVIPIGPLYVWTTGIAEDGSILGIAQDDLLGQQEDDVLRETFDPGIAMHQRTLDWLQCRNIQVVNPQRSRHEQKRIDRTGITVSELHVFSLGVSSRSEKGMPLQGGIPLSSVRGHFNEYGINGKGLLFGKYSGGSGFRTMREGHAEYGKTEQHFTLEES